MRLIQLYEVSDDDYSPEHLAKERSLKFKAGVIPFVRENGIIRGLFIISSDPKFGDTDPAIIKGGPDEGETPRETALREMTEEVGIPQSLVTDAEEIFVGEVKGLLASYKMHVFAVELKSKPNVHIDKNEIASAVWLTVEEFLHKGRESQRKIVQKLQ